MEKLQHLNVAESSEQGLHVKKIVNKKRKGFNNSIDIGGKSDKKNANMQGQEGEEILRSPNNY